MRPAATHAFVLAVLLVAACAPAGYRGDRTSAGASGKADGRTVEVTVPAAVDGAAGTVPIALGRLARRMSVRVMPLRVGAGGTLPDDASALRLRLDAASDVYRRTSITGEQPRLVLPVDGGEVDYDISLINDGPEAVTVEVTAAPVGLPSVGVQTYFNQPDCDEQCSADRLIRDPQDPSNGLRAAIIDAIQGARQSIDFAIFGLEDEPIQEALCHAAASGVSVRLVTDWRSRDPENSRGYYEALARLALCIEPIAGYDPATTVLDEADFSARGIQFVMNNAIMHHKFYLIDRATPDEVLVTGSANQTTSGLEKNHNHLLFLRGATGLAAAYAADFEQLFTHCRNNTDRRGRSCSECTATCTMDLNEEGPWSLDDPDLGHIEMSAYFSPTKTDGSSDDDSLRVLRGPVESRRVWVSKRGTRFCVHETTGARGVQSTTDHECVDAASNGADDLSRAREEADAIKGAVQRRPDERCDGPGSTCACHRAGSGKWTCDYCGGADGIDFGLLSNVQHRAMATLFAATDLCFGLAMGRAAEGGARAVMIFDRVNSFSEYARDDYACSMGVETYVDDWAGQSAVIFNHNKIIVVDDQVFDGSMNISASGIGKNNENTVVYRGAGLADRFAEYIEAEAALLRRRAVDRRMRGMCEREPMGGTCEAMATEIEALRADGRDPEKLAGLVTGRERCLELAAQWDGRCSQWQADRAGYVQRELPTERTSGLYDNPKSLRDCLCNDHVDNDHDGLVDQDVPQCAETSCFDRDDNDADGLIDAIDPDCSTPGESVL